MWYVQGGTVAVCTVGLRTQNSEFISVVRSMADGLRETCRVLWISIPTQTVTLNTDPQSVVAQWVGQRKREGVVGGSVWAGVENPSIGAAVACRRESQRWN